MSDVTERRVRPIQDALAAGNYKQALKDCEKWQKKGESSDRFLGSGPLALKAAVLLQQSDAKSRDKGKAEVQQLCQKTPAIVNVDAIFQLQDSLRQLSLGREEGPKVWERAIAARPGDKELLQTWLQDSISESNWTSAQKATTALRKISTQDRQYEFWNILMCYFISQDSSLPRKDRSLFGTLSNRMITKIAQATDASKGISNPEKLSILGAVLLHTGGSKDLVTLVQDANLSRTVTQDPLLADTILLQALDESNDQNQMLSFCEERLFSSDSDHEPSTDDRAWRFIAKLTKSEHARKDYLSRLNTVLAAHPQHRQAMLAKIEILVFLTKTSASSDELIKACKEYFTTYGEKAFCFDDLISRIASEGLDTVKGLYTSLTSSDSNTTSPTRELFLLKLEYHILLQQTPTRKAIEAFATKALTLHTKTSSSSSNTATSSEAAYIAALSLLNYASTSTATDPTLPILALTILQTSLTTSKDYYPTTILLLQLQIHLGQIHHGMQNFVNLSIKNLQWITVGHLMLTRISTLHPYQHGRGDDALNPLGALDTAMNVLEKADGSLDRAINDGLKMGSYSNVIDSFALRRQVHRSLVRQLFALEERKCQRAWGVSVTEPLVMTKDELVDLRDYSFMPCYGVQQSGMLEWLRCGPVPGRGWIDAMTVADHVATYLQFAMEGRDDKAETVLDLLEKAGEQPDDVRSELTEAEKDSHDVHLALAELLLQVNGRVKSKELGQPLEDVYKWMKLIELGTEPPTINGVAFPSGSFLHTSFVHLQALRLVGLFTSVIEKKVKTASKAGGDPSLKESMTWVRKQAKERVDAIHDQVRKLKQGLNAEGVLGKLVDAASGRAPESSSLSEQIQLLQDEVTVESMCGAARESWEDALDGVLKEGIKV